MKFVIFASILLLLVIYSWFLMNVGFELKFYIIYFYYYYYINKNKK